MKSERKVGDPVEPQEGEEVDSEQTDQPAVVHPNDVKPAGQ